MKKILSFLLMLVMCIALISPSTVFAAVKVSKNKATMEMDSTLLLKISGTKSKASWSSNNKDIASVSSSGLVTAIEPGTATITATVSKKKYTCVISVVDSSIDEVTAKKGTITELTTGMYIIGEDFPAGKYNLKAISGSGNFFVHGDDFVNEILSEEGDETFDTHEYNNLRLYYGDEMKITNGVVVEFTKLD